MILVITEKPKIATIICQALAGKRNCPYIKVSGIKIFKLESNKSKQVVIVPLEGHITEMDSSEEYENWRRTDPLKLIIDDKAIVKYYTSIKHVEALKKLAHRASRVVIATDADEEGCAIGLDALKVVQKYNPSVEVKRLWLSTTRLEDVREAWEKLISPKYSWAYAVEARRRIDAIIGFSATRELTLLAQQSRGINSSLISIGRVQTALLYLIYRREREIREFKPKPYWSIFADIDFGNGKIVRFSYVKNPVWSEEEAKKILSELRGFKWAKIAGLEENKEGILPPPPLNTTRLLSLLSSKLGISPSKAMKIAEDLYLDALITYPRTDTDKFTTFEHKKIIELISSSTSELSKYAARILRLNPKCHLTRNGFRYVGDHEPIAPIGVPSSKISKLHLRAWDIIARRYLALFYPPALVINRKILLNIGDFVFNAEGREIADKGYLEVYGSIESIAESSLPSVSIGESYRIAKVYVRKRYTKPPARYKESELVTLMEKHGIGTKSSRPEIISTLKKRNYIEVRSGRVYMTELGYKLAGFISSIWGSFATPDFTKEVEELMESVKTGRLTWQEAVRRTRDKYLELFKKLRSEKTKLFT